jgi:hypothetical protein
LRPNKRPRVLESRLPGSIAQLGLAVTGLTIVGPQPAAAQRIETVRQDYISSPTLSPSQVNVRSLTWAWPPDSSRRTRTYAREGALIGGVAIGLLGAITGVGLCHFDDPCRHPAPFAIGGFVLGALAGVGLGGRIGAAFPKFQSHRSRDPALLRMDVRCFGRGRGKGYADTVGSQRSIRGSREFARGPSAC